MKKLFLSTLTLGLVFTVESVLAQNLLPANVQQQVISIQERTKGPVEIKQIPLMKGERGATLWLIKPVPTSPAADLRKGKSNPRQMSGGGWQPERSHFNPMLNDLLNATVNATEGECSARSLSRDLSKLDLSGDVVIDATLLEDKTVDCLSR